MRLMPAAISICVTLAISPALAGADGVSLFITDRGEPTESDPLIQRYDVEGSTSSLLLLDVVAPEDIALDPDNWTMYWVDDAGLRRANLDGRDFLTLDPRATAKGVDVAPEHVYWALATGEIWRAGLDGENAELVVDAGTDWVALDLHNDKLYWSNAQTIKRSDLDGSNVETVLVATSSVGCIAVDGAAGRLYWIENTGIYRAYLDGTGVETVVSQSSIHVLDLDRTSDYVYYTRIGTDVRRVRVDGSDDESLFSDAPTQKHGLAVRSEGEVVPAVSAASLTALLVAIMYAFLVIELGTRRIDIARHQMRPATRQDTTPQTG